MCMDISVVIPVYGCRAALPELYRRLIETLEGMKRSFEIVLVDDCCPQNSWIEIEKICQKDKRVVGIHLSRNFGQIRAITCGLDASKGDWVVVMDCDLQDRPEAIDSCMKRLKKAMMLCLFGASTAKILHLPNSFRGPFTKYMNTLQTETTTIPSRISRLRLGK